MSRTTCVVGARVPASTYDALYAVARQRNMPMSELVRRLIDDEIAAWANKTGRVNSGADPTSSSISLGVERYA